MPYVNIPNSNIGGVVAKAVGRIQGRVLGGVLDQVYTTTTLLRTEQCPNPSQLQSAQQNLDQLNTTVNSLDNKLKKFERLAKRLKTPLRGLKAAKKVILTLPIPQSVPPGFGIPISITTKYADILHLLKELIKQIEETIEIIEQVLKTPSSSINSVKSRLSLVDSAIKCCEVNQAITDEFENGDITTEELQDIGIVDADGSNNLVPIRLQILGYNTVNNSGDIEDERNNSGVTLSDLDSANLLDNLELSQPSDATIVLDPAIMNTPIGDLPTSLKQDVRRLLQSLSDDEKKKLNKIIKGRSLSDSEDKKLKARRDLDLILRKTQTSNLSKNTKDKLRSVLRTLKELQDSDLTGREDYYYTSPSGEVYKLEIVTDPDSPPIAIRHYAIAKSRRGITVMKGPSSFSSSTKVLLDEVKFRLANRLP